MKAPAVLIPFKGEGFKSRLSPILGQQDRREVAYLLLSETLRAVEKAGMLPNCHVVTADAGADVLAKRSGSHLIRESHATGVNGAIKLALKTLKDESRILVIPSDLPLLSAADLRRAVQLGAELPCVISPSSAFNGTNLLIFERKRMPPLSYDNDSFWNHLSGAAQLRLRTAVFTPKGILFDLDTPSDANELLSLDVNTSVSRFLRKSIRK